MFQTQIELTETQFTALEELAIERQVSLTDLIHEAIDRLLQAAVVEDAERRRRALAAAGRFNSGLGDLSTRHDDYLAEDFDS